MKHRELFTAWLFSLVSVLIDDSVVSFTSLDADDIFIEVGKSIELGSGVNQISFEKYVRGKLK